ncbi:hypothetical protein GGI25_001722 [Coemansia spiralis]|uniref:Uncharacterized protein n=2 Tax=Coemansia TaxID=4863 RepID=A0A9W8G520_9FUNG|nr:hypothetical protein EDC05_003474 [Coemansia umbellata]KAJ2624938.1 hypothetical protein GGI26_001050 [Coemansia sp. RSA 1358]KAJ2679154.1 hypothetical protein GGI25_001722 [Coemansia spiralis]
MYKPSCFAFSDNNNSCCLVLPPASTSPSSPCYHRSRSSSVSTVVAVSPMCIPHPSPSSFASSIDCYTAAVSPTGGPAAAIAIHPHTTPLKPRATSPCDSVISGMLNDNVGCADSDDGMDDPLTDNEDFDEPIFDMDSEKSPPHLKSPPCSQPSRSLNPADLTYRHIGKPQPWAVRPIGVYDSHRAQIQAIDDDDNEFYLS